MKPTYTMSSNKGASTTTFYLYGEADDARLMRERAILLHRVNQLN